jgi:hypothetical protein
MLTIELVFNITPLFCSFMYGTTALDILNIALTFKSIILAKSFDVVSSIFLLADIPALLTRISICPYFLLISLITFSI